MNLKDRFKFQKIFYIYLNLSIIFLLAPAFINFDSHHDGLVLSTVLELKRAIEGGGAWPFNQYGQLWAFPFVFVSFLVSDQYLLIAIRLLTFIFYIATAFVIHRTSTRYLVGNYAKIPSLLFLVAQPFALGLNSSFLPWPSALCLLMVSIVLERLTSQNKSPFQKDLSSFIIGVLVLVILGTRFQVGMLMLFSIGLLLFMHRQTRELVLYLTGFSLSFLFIELYMISQGWFFNSLYDSIIFSSQYVSGDTSTYPVPKVTFMLSIWILLSLFGLKLISRNTYSRFILKRKYFYVSLALIFVAISVACILSSIDAFSWITLFIRRSWISFAIAFMIFSLIILIIQLIKNGTIFEKRNFQKNALVIVSLCSFSQVVPLFDQMHFWWGFSPLVILVILTIQQNFSQVIFLERHFKISFLLVAGLLIFINFIGVSKQLSSADSRMSSSIATGIVVSDSTDNDISAFLNQHIDTQSSILSLCPNSNAIFSLKSSKSAIREFVLWSPTFDFEKYREDFLEAKYDVVVACSLTNATDAAQKRINSSISEVLALSELLNVASFTDSHNRTWSIYKHSR